MWIEIGAPASLPLGVVRLEDDGRWKTHLIGVTLQHPPVNLRARAHTALQVTGPRADRAYALAERFLKHHSLNTGAEVEVELAIPHAMGLSSDAMLGLSVARALAWLNGLPSHDTAALAAAVGLGPSDALPIWGFDQGGLLLVSAQASPTADAAAPTVRRRAIAHADRDAWAFVFLLPPASTETPETLEADRLAALRDAAPHLSAESGRVVMEEIWPAVDHDDFASFAQALMKLQQLNQEALAKAGRLPPLTKEEQAVLDLIREQGALATGRSPTGMALYGLIQGATPSVELRQKISRHVGIFGGTVMATIVDNGGARHVLEDEIGSAITGVHP